MTQCLQSISRWSRRLIFVCLALGCEPDQFVSMGSDGGGASALAQEASGGRTANDDVAVTSGAGGVVGDTTGRAGTNGEPIGGAFVAGGASGGDVGNVSGVGGASGGDVGSVSSAGGAKYEIPRRIARALP